MLSDLNDGIDSFTLWNSKWRLSLPKGEEFLSENQWKHWTGEILRAFKEGFRGFPMLQLPYQFGRSGMDWLNISRSDEIG
ncbi:putative cytochrome c biogenesis ccmB-like mitochondrial protein [Capsicum baccatum]|uniref:Cytochrome c biogenesis ccmB-like mitochondrial protein n=1 Tax=Capsicum baccatum TaxID=33114 RepID=A0A2G2WTJ2_CAPBA|nr:putative cytochrome c biogenesis ccmB-like mitochondrial protein [Capsicum baccatum]